jgi:hypothetical protein
VRRSLALLFSLVLLASASAGVTHAADTPDEQYVPSGPPSPTSVGVQFKDSLFTEIASYLSTNIPLSNPTGNPGSSVSQILCGSPSDSSCLRGNTISYLAHLPRCESSTQSDCVDSVWAVKSDGTKVTGAFMASLPESLINPYVGDPNLAIPSPGVDSVWTIPGITNGAGTDTYLVSSILSGLTQKPSGSVPTGSVPLTEFDAGIYPVHMINGTYIPSHVDSVSDSSGRKGLRYYSPGGVGAESCVAVSTKLCALHESFPNDIRFGLSLRFSQEIRGWLHGRLLDPLVTYTGSNSGGTLNIEALPTNVPVISAWTDSSNLPAVIPGTYDGTIQPGTSIMGWPWGDVMAKLLKIWLPIIKNTAQAQPSEWIVRNLSASEMEGTKGCMEGVHTLAGFVSTNSTVYTAGPPKFNPDTQSLDYTLVSPHFTANGSVFKGVYTLAIKSDVARCIYKFTNAPIKATISITDDSGQSSVAVESMNEHDGWIYLSASNFEFSSPTVHIKLTGTPIAAPTPKPIVTPSAPSPSPTRPIAKKTTMPKKISISCLKGSVIKKVTAVKPVCPKGFRKVVAR